MSDKIENLKINELNGANMDIDLTSLSNDIKWKQDVCPWNKKEGTNEHKCAVKNVSICDYFCGIKFLDIVLCSYPKKNPHEEDEKKPNNPN